MPSRAPRGWRGLRQTPRRRRPWRRRRCATRRCRVCRFRFRLLLSWRLYMCCRLPRGVAVRSGRRSCVAQAAAPPASAPATAPATTKRCTPGRPRASRAVRRPSLHRHPRPQAPPQQGPPLTSRTRSCRWSAWWRREAEKGVPKLVSRALARCMVRFFRCALQQWAKEQLGKLGRRQKSADVAWAV